MVAGLFILWRKGGEKKVAGKGEMLMASKRSGSKLGRAEK